MTDRRWLIAIGFVALVCGLEFACLKAFSPHEEIKPVTTTEVEASGGSTVTTFQFSSVAGQAGWGASALGLIGVIASTIKVRRRDQALDTVIGAIEQVRCIDCKNCVRKQNNAVINARVKKLTKAA